MNAYTIWPQYKLEILGNPQDFTDEIEQEVRNYFEGELYEESEICLRLNARFQLGVWFVGNDAVGDGQLLLQIVHDYSDRVRYLEFTILPYARNTAYADVSSRFYSPAEIGSRLYNLAATLGRLPGLTRPRGCEPS